MNIRPLVAGDLAAAGALAHEAFATVSREHGMPPPWPTAAEGVRRLERCLALEPEGALVAEQDGRVAGVGFARRRGDVATIGPLAAWPPGAGVGSAILEGLLSIIDGWGCAAVRLFQDAFNPDSFGFYGRHGFAVVDVVACVERPPWPGPRIDGSRALEIAAPKAGDLREIGALDLRVTGLTRPADLEDSLRLVARRRGSLAGFLAARGSALGPAIALDVADLGALVARTLADAPTRGHVARLSTAAPTAMLAFLALGFRVSALGTVLSRGPTPPARPPQLYALDPEIL